MIASQTLLPLSYWVSGGRGVQDMHGAMREVAMCRDFWGSPTITDADAQLVFF